MPYDPTLPKDNSLVAAGELRGQFAGLKSLIDQHPSFADVDTEIAKFGPQPMSVTGLGLTVSDPPTQSEVQAIADKLDELINALQVGQ